MLDSNLIDISFEEALQILAYKVMDSEVKYITSFFLDELDTTLTRDEEWHIDNETFGEDELRAKIVSGFQDADSKTVERLLSDWTASDLKYNTETECFS